MFEILYEAGIILALVLANGVFSMSEMAIVSVRKARLQKRAQDGDKGAQAAIELANNPSSFLSTVQVGITLIGVLAGAFGGARAAALIAQALADAGMSATQAQSVGFAIVIVAITYLSLVIGELVPKRLSLAFGEQIACWIARPMTLLSKLAYPLVKLLDVSSDVVVWLMRVKPPGEAPPSEDEIRIMVGQAATAGVIEKSEHDMVHNALAFADRSVVTVMTRAPDVIWLSSDDSDETVRGKVARAGHSHYPVCEKGIDNLIGVVSAKVLVGRPHFKRLEELREYYVGPLYVPASMQNLALLEQFKATRKHIAFVIDEFGRVEGLVTLIDLMESLVGEIPTDKGEDDAQLVQRDDGSWLVDGLAPIEIVKSKFKIDVLPNEEKGMYHTVGGFALMYLGRVPKAGDRFVWAAYSFEILDMDGNRVDKVLIARKSGESARTFVR